MSLAVQADILNHTQHGRVEKMPGLLKTWCEYHSPDIPCPEVDGNEQKVKITKNIQLNYE